MYYKEIEHNRLILEEVELADYVVLSLASDEEETAQSDKQPDAIRYYELSLVCSFRQPYIQKFTV